MCGMGEKVGDSRARVDQRPFYSPRTILSMNSSNTEEILSEVTRGGRTSGQLLCPRHRRGLLQRDPLYRFERLTGKVLPVRSVNSSSPGQLQQES